MTARWVRILIIPALFLMLGSAAPRAAAQDAIPVQIKADVFRYDRRTRVLTATGNVLLIFEDVRIRADALVANLESGDVTAEGHVLLEVGTASVAADVLSYNLHSRFGALTNVRTSYTGPLVLGAVHLRAQRFEGIPDELATIRGGFVTTCDEDDPVVHLTADEITVYLNDRIVGRRVSLWLGGRKVFTWPYFQIFLRERRQSRLIPVVGYSEIEGVFVKTTYSYVVNERQYGFLYGDWMDRLGIGLGIEHVYRAGAGSGSLFLYRLANKLTAGTDLHGVFTHTQPITPNLSTFLYADYFQQDLPAPGVSTSSLFGAFDLSYTTPRSFTFLFATASTASPGPASAFTGFLAHSQSLGPELSAQAFLGFSRLTGSLGSDDEARPHLALSYYGGTFSAALVAETRWDLDGDIFPFDDQYTLERLPELTFSLAPRRLGESFLVWQVQGGAGHFRETTVGPGGGTLDASRIDAAVTLSGPIPIGDGILGLRTFARGTWYTTGASRFFYGGRVEYTQPLGPAVLMRLGYTGQAVAGASPFLFDQITGSLSFADAQLSYQTSNLFAGARVFYDFMTGQFGNILAEAIYLPQPGWAIGLAGSYNLQLGRFDRAEAVLDLQLSKEWRVQYSGAYDGTTGRVIHDRVAITRIFCDCLAVSLSYLGARGEIWLEGWLTAIPWAKGKIGVGQYGNVLFDLPAPIIP